MEIDAILENPAARALGAMLVTVLFLSYVPLWWIILVPVVLGMAYMMQVQILHTRALSRHFWLTTYLRKDRPIYQYLRNSMLLPWIAWAIAVPLAAVTYVTVFCYDFVDCLAIFSALAAAFLIHRRFTEMMEVNVSSQLVELASIRFRYFVSVTLVLACLAAGSIAKSGFTNYADMTSDAIASQTISEIKHPAKLVQHCARTLRYSELQLLRIRDINGGLIGWMIYLFFLVPNALPAFGLVTFFSGIERFVGVQKK